MSRLAESFRTARASAQDGFIPFLVAGDPDLQTTAKLLPALSKLGPIAIEVGVPFSDPTADGPVIQRATQRALGKGTSLAKILWLLKRFRPNELAPIVLFSYYNPILQFGIERFARVGGRARCGGRVGGRSSCGSGCSVAGTTAPPKNRSHFPRHPDHDRRPPAANREAGERIHLRCRPHWRDRHGKGADRRIRGTREANSGGERSAGGGWIRNYDGCASETRLSLCRRGGGRIADCVRDRRNQGKRQSDRRLRAAVPSLEGFNRFRLGYLGPALLAGAAGVVVPEVEHGLAEMLDDVAAIEVDVLDQRSAIVAVER